MDGMRLELMHSLFHPFVPPLAQHLNHWDKAKLCRSARRDRETLPAIAATASFDGTPFPDTKEEEQSVTGSLNELPSQVLL